MDTERDRPGAEKMRLLRTVLQESGAWGSKRHPGPGVQGPTLDPYRLSAMRALLSPVGLFEEMHLQLSSLPLFSCGRKAFLE